MKARERSEVLDAFTDAIDKDTGSRKQKNNFQILIGTTRLIGAGLQLTRAANLVLMEPDHEFYRELQAVARIHRIGQKNPRSYSFRLINEGSEFETRILKRQEERGEIHGREIETRLISEVMAEQEHKELINGDGLIPVDDEVREEWMQEHDELLDQFPMPPMGTPGTDQVPQSRFIEHLSQGQNAENGDLYNAEG
jgi:hypothetical protein